ncbi:MAG: type II secretion system F family protein [Clostridia bacterium]|nr:type II secretion system F family protein [Clostridia bacterium]
MAIIISGITCLIFVGTFLFAYLKSKGVYDEYLEPVDKKEYPLKDFFPIGYTLNEFDLARKLIPAKFYKYIHKYKMKVSQQIIEIYGPKYSDYYTMLHNANRTAMGVTVAAGASLLSLIMAASGDNSTCFIFVFIAFAAFFAMPFLVDKGLNDKIEKRRLAIRIEFPEFVNKMTILVNAGMTISKAWQKIATDSKKTTPLFTEMQYTMAEISAGKPEAVAYEEFGRRCKIKEIIKFVSVIVLNLKKGGAEVVPVLKLQAAECWEMRKSAAKQLGEEAGTKVLIPMMIMFIGIIMIVVLPAILSFSSGM